MFSDFHQAVVGLLYSLTEVTHMILLLMIMIMMMTVLMMMLLMQMMMMTMIPSIFIGGGDQHDTIAASM